MIMMRQLRRVRFVEVSENNVFVRGRRLSPQSFARQRLRTGTDHLALVVL